LNIVDLAGAERFNKASIKSDASDGVAQQREKARIAEANIINGSLAALGKNCRFESRWAWFRGVPHTHLFRICVARLPVRSAHAQVKFYAGCRVHLAKVPLARRAVLRGNTHSFFTSKLCCIARRRV
jgi:hypothetical protein